MATKVSLGQDPPAELRILRNWNKKLLSLPVHKDLPRLLKHSSIEDVNGYVLWAYEEKRDLIEDLYTFLITLANAVNEPQNAKEIEDNFHSYFVQPQVPLALKKFFSETPIKESSKLFAVLRCIQQEIICTPVMELRQKVLYSEYPYKDLPGTWNFKIVVGDQISITHLKGERSHNSDPTKYFEFFWAFEIRFNKDFTSIQPHLSVTDWKYGPKVPSELKKKLEESLSILAPDYVPYMRVWKRSVIELAMHATVIRLLDKIIITGSKDTLYEHDSTKSREQNVTAFIRTLTEWLEEPDMADEIMSKLEKSLNQGGDLSNQMKYFFVLTESIHHTRTFRMIKTLHPHLRYQAILTLRNSFFEKFPFVDIRGGWHVNIRLSAGSKGTVSVVHFNKAKSHGDEATQSFDFEWKLIMTFNKYLTTLSTETIIFDWHWGDKTAHDTRCKIKAAFSPFITRDTRFYRMWNRDSASISEDLSLSLGRNISSLEIKRGKKVMFASKPTQKNSVALLVLAELSRCPEAVEYLEEKKKKLSAGSSITPIIGHLMEMNGTKHLMGVLKCLQRAILVPAAIEFREDIHKEFPFKETRKHWVARVSYLPDGRVNVVHRRKEQSRDIAPETFFEFDWELKVTYNPEHDNVSATFKIFDWSFSNLCPKSRQMAIEKALMPYAAREALYNRVAKRPLDKFTMATALTGLVSRVEILDENDQRIFKHSPTATVASGLRSFLTTLAVRLEEREVSDKIDSVLDKYLKSTIDATKGIDDFFRRGGLIECGLHSDSRMIVMLKFCTTDMLIPCILFLRKKYYTKCPYVETKGSWRVRIKFGKRHFKVEHIRQEHSKSDQLDEYFKFNWDLTFTFYHKALQDFKASFRITGMAFHESIDPSIKAYLQFVFHDV
eukprot:CAMPEP_0168532980 /NCGR_PEP_ID=MMETSP0405-20121227/16720_1 /TAXON_ID=498012 /ORGANISM="Trichosphaerium sp, Strain Am-I-7 wt" /LENGTH=891 /DNA_ID=CAMNT_0008558785 /DNA_START=11 /DNA_END=2682 /DNA_ORIENTATION=+